MNIIIGTPCYDGRLSCFYVNSMIDTIRNTPIGMTIYPIYLSFDALIQRARNDLIAIAIEHKVDALIFIDSDLEWQADWLFKLLDYKEDIVGGTVRKKTDNEELYNVNTQNLKLEENGLIKVNSIGTGFVKISQKALQALWNSSPEYTNEGNKRRMCCNVEIVDGELMSEDVSMMKKFRELGFDVFIDPEICCPHLGEKKFIGNFSDFRKRLIQPQLKVVGGE
jgi:glycosyltransferase involved in cell wall biosynthesis